MVTATPIIPNIVVLTTPQSGQTPRCPRSSNPVAGTIADYADQVGFAADGVTVGAVAFGLLTVPTGAGPAGAGILAAGAKAVGMIANVVGGVANIVDGNYVTAGGNALAVFAGNGTGPLATSALTRSRMFGGFTTQGERVVAGVDSGTAFGVQASMKAGSRGR